MKNEEVQAVTDEVSTTTAIARTFAIHSFRIYVYLQYCCIQMHLICG